jgi:hypothetical protein
MNDEMIPLAVAVDTVLCKLSDAKPGDVLVIRAENGMDGHLLSDALAQCRMPAGSIPRDGIQIVVCRPGAEWSLERKDARDILTLQDKDGG